MNLELRVVIRYLGLLMLVLSALIGGVAAFAAYDRLMGHSANSGDLRALLTAAFVGFFLGGSLFVAGRHAATEMLGQREALLLVACSWLFGAALGALPFWFWSAGRPDVQTAAHDFDPFVNCYFEAMSGLTTTGATVVQSIGSLPRSLLLWRALTQWLGGLGIVVLFVAVLPILGGVSRRIYRIEAAGPSSEGVKPRIQDTARILWLIYLGMTVLETLALKLCGMTWFDSVCHTFATLATGGFSTQDASIAAYAPAVHIVIIVFMILAGINFGLYHQLLLRQWRTVKKDPELRVYLSIILVATVIITISLLRDPSRTASSTGEPATIASASRHALFQVVAIQTTTGYCSADFDQWGFVAKATLFVLMFIGASAGSTGGGIKVVRIIAGAKILLAELEHVYRPKVVRPVKIGKSTIDPDLKLSTMVYLVSIALLFAIGTVLLMLLEAGNNIDITSAASASAASLNNIGPGFARVGATHNYAWFTAPSKIVLSILMLLGRLEMFTIIVLFSPRFWKTK